MMHSDLLGSRPMELDTAQRREARALEIKARTIAGLILLALGYGLWRLL